MTVRVRLWLKFNLDVKPHIEKLRKHIEANDFAGYDPYDALNSPALRLLSSRSKYLRIFFTQLLKKLPINLRPILGIKKGLNPKALGLFLWGYAKLYAVSKDPSYLQTIYQLLDLLEETKSKGYSGNCWGYNFDWQSRAFYVPKYTPTIVNSSFVGHALVDTYRLTGLERALNMALSIPSFILNDLNRTNDNGNHCFSYTPLDSTAVHNANLLGASLLIRIYKYAIDEMLKQSALSALAYAMDHQREDGSWYYAETDFQKWIDSFHTGFNLQSIYYFLQEGLATEHEKQFNKGVSFYKENFFLNDGTPKYYHNRIYPIDIHSPSQAIAFFSSIGDEFKDFTRIIFRWMINYMQDEKGFFYFQKTPFFTNKISYLRWSQAWAFHALTSFYYHYY